MGYKRKDQAFAALIAAQADALKLRQHPPAPVMPQPGGAMHIYGQRFKRCWARRWKKIKPVAKVLGFSLLVICGAFLFTGLLAFIVGAFKDTARSHYGERRKRQ
jgi:hypothetical protein